MPGQDLQGQGHGPGGGPQQRALATRRRAEAGGDDAVDAAQQQRQPDDGGDDHREDGGADDQELRPLIDQPGHRRPAAPQAQDAAEGVHTQPGQPHLAEGEPAEGLGQRQDEKEDAERVEHGVLPVGQEGRAGEEVRVPQRNLAAAQAVERELLPGGVLDGQVGDEGVVGRQGVELGRRGGPRRPLEKHVGRNHRASAERHRGVEQQGQDEVAQSDEEVGAAGAKLGAHHAIGSLSRRKTHSAAPAAWHSVCVTRNSWPRPKWLIASSSRPTVRLQTGPLLVRPQQSGQRSTV